MQQQEEDLKEPSKLYIFRGEGYIFAYVQNQLIEKIYDITDIENT